MPSSSVPSCVRHQVDGTVAEPLQTQSAAATVQRIAMHGKISGASCKYNQICRVKVCKRI